MHSVTINVTNLSFANKSIQLLHSICVFRHNAIRHASFDIACDLQVLIFQIIPLWFCPFLVSSLILLMDLSMLTRFASILTPAMHYDHSTCNNKSIYSHLPLAFLWYAHFISRFRSLSIPQWNPILLNIMDYIRVYFPTAKFLTTYSPVAAPVSYGSTSISCASRHMSGLGKKLKKVQHLMCMLCLGSLVFLRTFSNRMSTCSPHWIN